jgi:hypothetical protein
MNKQEILERAINAVSQRCKYVNVWFSRSEITGAKQWIWADAQDLVVRLSK